MKRMTVWFAGLAVVSLLLSSCAKIIDNPQITETTQTQQSTGPSSLSRELPAVGYGYANIDGSKLMVLNDDYDIDTLLTRFAYAVGEDENPLEITYSHYQMGNEEKDTSRQTAKNFDNEAGCLYLLGNIKAVPNATYVLLTQAEHDNSEILNKPGNVEEVPAPGALLAQCAGLAGRNIQEGWRLAEYPNGIRLSTVQFERDGPALLAWVVLEDGGNIRHFDYPVILDNNGTSGWRAGDGAEFNHQGRAFRVLAVFRQDTLIKVCYQWFGELELINEIDFFYDGTAVERIGASRYHFNG